MSQPFAAGKHAFGFCDRCGFRYDLKELKSEVIDLNPTGYLVCSECWDPDNPQYQLGREPISGAEALENPRPTGATAGREIPNTYRAGFETGLDGWTEQSGIITWTGADTQTITIESLPGNPYSGNPRIHHPGLVTLDATNYKYLRCMFRVNRFPAFPGMEPSDLWAQDFRGAFFWGDSYSGDRVAYVSPRPVFTNSPVGTWYQVTWDMNGQESWAGESFSTKLRIDFFNAENAGPGGPDEDAGVVEIDWISVDKF
jgi:hypothetical protein